MALLEQRRQGALFFAYSIAFRIAENNPLGTMRYLPKGWKMNKLFCSHDEIRWLFDQDEIIEAGRALMQEFLSNPRQMNLTFDLFEKVRVQCEGIAKRYAFVRPGLLSTPQIVGIIREYFSLYDEMWDTGAMAEELDFYLSSIITPELQRHGIPEKEIPGIISTLSAPTEESFNRKAEKRMLEIVQTIQERALSFPHAFEDAQVKEMVKQYILDYYWTPCNYFTFSGLGMENVKSLIQRTAEQSTFAKEKLEGWAREQRELAAQKRALQKKYHLDEKIALYLSLLAKVARMYDDRKKMQMYGFYSMGRMLKELAKREKVDYDLAKYILPSEVPDFAAGKIPVETLRARRTHTAIDYSTNPPLFLTGHVARAAEEKIWLSVTTSQNEISGQCACPGKIVAKARVIRSTKNLSELQQGEILVTGMTSPEYVPALGKAVGIITDDGGITCHAGIISREMKIPCIVGTKLATRKIKTGDLVDLRAHHGLARIVQKSASNG